jgi:hypothetical protein
VEAEQGRLLTLTNEDIMEKYLLSLSLLSSLSAGQLLAVPAYAGPHHQNDAMGPLLFDLIETA